MFAFLRRSPVHHPSLALQAALAARGLPPGMDPSTLRVVEGRGSYAGRGVTYVLVFDPVRTDELGLSVRGARDLAGQPDLVLAAGHVEQDGSVVLHHEDVTTSPAAGPRQPADRADHLEDEAIVFPDGRPA